MIDSRLAPYGAFVLRVSLGIMFLAHAYLKLVVFTVPGFAEFLASLGLPSLLAWPIVMAELVGGFLILVGWQARLVQLALLPVLLGAFFTHVPFGWVFSAPGGGFEYPAFLLAAAVTHILTGDGVWAIRASSLHALRR